jgi:hypothetical protein
MHRYVHQLLHIHIKSLTTILGVLTKPNRLPPGSRHYKLQEVFDQKRFALGHGYFVVKNLGQDEIDMGLSHHQARLQEQQFFSQEAPWATTFGEYQARFGTLNLQRFLSGKLVEQITKRLPIIDQGINDRLRQVESDLLQFPEPPTHNAPRIIYDILSEFSHAVRKELEAEFPCKDWRNNWKALQRAFFDALASMKPTMSTSGKRDAGVYLATLPGKSAKDAISVDDEDDDEEDEDGDAQMSSNPETPTKKRKLEGGTPVPSPVKTPSRREAAKPTEARNVSPDFRDLRKIFYLDGDEQHIKENSDSRAPGQIEPRVVDNMMLETIEHWGRPLDEFFDTLEAHIRSQIEALFMKHFNKWEGSALHRNAWKIVDEMLNLNFHQQRTTMADEVLNDENEGPYIFHDDIFEREKNAVLGQYREARLNARLKIYKREKLAKTGKATSAVEEAKLMKDERVMGELKSEPYEVKLGLVAQVTTYYMIAARRFHDAICMRIECKFYKQFRTQLHDELENGLGLNDGQEGHHNAINLLAEPQNRYMQREELVGQRNSLIQGQKILKDLQSKKYGDTGLPQTPSAGSSGRFSSGSSFGGMPTPLPEEMDDIEMDGLPRR